MIYDFDARIEITKSFFVCRHVVRFWNARVQHFYDRINKKINGIDKTQ